MKVYTTPVPFAEPDYANYNNDIEVAREEAHKAELKQHLIEMGYTGEFTGEIISRHVADGAAQYMLADGKGRYGPSFLAHLPYGDAYQARDIQHVPKSAIIAEIKRWRKFEADYAKASRKTK